MTPDQEYVALLAEYGVKQSQEERAREFEQARRDSVTQPPHAVANGVASWTAVQSPQGPILPPWGTRRREWALRLWDRHEYNTLWQGATSGLIKRWCATDWVVEGGKILANKYQRVLRNAVSNEWIGWDTWLASVARDYLRFDGGAWIEVVGAGDPRSELVGGVVGLNHLDSYTTWPTGDPEFPCVYWSRLGKYNLMHRSRVIHLVDMPDGDVLNPGYGLCALSRCIAVVERQMREQRYIAINLNDIPSSGVVISENLTPDQIQQAYAAMERRTQNDTPGQPGNVVWLTSMNPAFPADLKTFTFSRPPEKFDWDTYVRIDVNMMALAIGEDPQDLWPLSSAAMGSGMQSEILAKKGRGKMYGQFLKVLERELNSVLPEALEFMFKVVDPDEQRKEADVAKAWGDALTAIGQRMSFDEGRRLLSDNVEQINNVVTDAAGEMVELPDFDIRPLDAGQIAPNTNPALAPTAQQAPVTAGDSTPNAPTGTKALADPQASFESDFNALLAQARAKKLKEREYRRRLLLLIGAAGVKAMLWGMAVGGVESTALSAAEKARYLLLLADQRQYITDWARELYKQGVSADEAATKAYEWWAKSVYPFQLEGMKSADANGAYKWTLGVSEHCPDCVRLEGQVHRLKDYIEKGIVPRASSLACSGYNCACNLRRVSEIEQGNWLT